MTPEQRQALVRPLLNALRNVDMCPAHVVYYQGKLLHWQATQAFPPTDEQLSQGE